MCLAVLVCGCAEKPDPKPEPEKDWKETYNGQLVLALADAYATWEVDNKLPSTVKWGASMSFPVSMSVPPSVWFSR